MRFAPFLALLLAACGTESRTDVTVIVDADLQAAYTPEEPGYVFVSYGQGNIAHLATVEGPTGDDLILEDAMFSKDCDELLDPDALGALVQTVQAWITRNQGAQAPSSGDPTASVLLTRDERCEAITATLELDDAL